MLVNWTLCGKKFKPEFVGVVVKGLENLPQRRRERRGSQRKWGCKVCGVLFFLPVFLSSCFSGNEQFVVQGLSAKKQRQKIALLQKKVELAEKEQRKVCNEVEELREEMNRARLALIHKQVDDYENKGGAPNLFLDERELLYRMIQEGPSPSAFTAQVELDRILRIITEFSDDQKRY